MNIVCLPRITHHAEKIVISEVFNDIEVIASSRLCPPRMANDSHLRTILSDSSSLTSIYLVAPCTTSTLNHQPLIRPSQHSLQNALQALCNSYRPYFRRTSISIEMTRTLSLVHRYAHLRHRPTTSSFLPRAMQPRYPGQDPLQRFNSSNLQYYALVRAL